MRRNKRALIPVLAVGLCLIPSSAVAAGAAGANPMIVEQAPPVHHFLDATNIGLQSINAIIMAVDLASTRRALQVPGTTEMNPLMRSQAGLTALKVAGVGAGIGIAYMMHRSGHHKAERWVPLVFGIPSAIAAGHNSGIH